MLLQLTQQEKKNIFTNVKWFHRFMRTPWSLRVLLCEYMNLLALRTENYFFNAKSLNLTARLAPMWQQSGTSLFCSCHGIAGFLVDELQI